MCASNAALVDVDLASAYLLLPPFYISDLQIIVLGITKVLTGIWGLKASRAIVIVVNDTVSVTESVTATLAWKLCLICKRELKPCADFVSCDECSVYYRGTWHV